MVVCVCLLRLLQDRAAALLQLQNQKSGQPALAPQEKQQLLAMARQREQQAAAEVEEREAAFRSLGEDGWADWFQVGICFTECSTVQDPTHPHGGCCVTQ